MRLTGDAVVGHPLTLEYTYIGGQAGKCIVKCVAQHRPRTSHPQSQSRPWRGWCAGGKEEQGKPRSVFPGQAFLLSDNAERAKRGERDNNWAIFVKFSELALSELIIELSIFLLQKNGNHPKCKKT